VQKKKGGLEKRRFMLRIGTQRKSAAEDFSKGERQPHRKKIRSKNFVHGKNRCHCERKPPGNLLRTLANGRGGVGVLGERSGKVMSFERPH